VTHLGVRNPSEVLIDTRRKSSRPTEDNVWSFECESAAALVNLAGQCIAGQKPLEIGVRKYEVTIPNRDILGWRLMHFLDAAGALRSS